MPYTSNSKTKTCDTSAFSWLNIPFYIILALTIISLVTAVTSKIVALIRKKRDKMMEQLYAYFTVVEFVNRFMFMIFLWISPKIFAFSINFMDLVCTGVLGVFFYTLYLGPILIHSPHFKSLMK